MQHLDLKFKDSKPEKTVERIQNILKNLGIVLEERWNDSGIENCHSLNVYVNNGYPLFSNGKGVTKELARASAYAEFIERLQCGLFLYKFQSITRDKVMNLQSFAPDGKYMTMAQLEEDGEWMDYIIQTYGNGLTRKKIAKFCKIYACTDEDKIWVIPFYSLFENKYVYLPAGLVEHIYSANGCCAGNTREEAWVHAFSEMMERRSTVVHLTGNSAAAPIPEEVLQQFPTASAILKKIRQFGQYDVQIFDFSLGNGFPVVATRIINKKTHSYVVNTAADPVLEIAIDRTLTEIFQGRNLDNFVSIHNGTVLSDRSTIPAAHNVLNQIENGSGLFPVSFFTEEISSTETCTQFSDRRNCTNKELLAYMTDLYRQLKRPVYVRNYSFLGFPCYQFVVPGFSETRGLRLLEPISEFALGDQAAGILRNPATASDEDLSFLLSFHKKVRTAFSRQHNFAGLAGLPLADAESKLLLYATLCYGAWRLGQFNTAAGYLDTMQKFVQIPDEDREYFACVRQYLALLSGAVEDEKIHSILKKFHQEKYTDILCSLLEAGKSPFHNHLLQCSPTSGCQNCRFAASCTYEQVRKIIQQAGKVYHTFSHGQDKQNFVSPPPSNP